MRNMETHHTVVESVHTMHWQTEGEDTARFILNTLNNKGVCFIWTEYLYAVNTPSPLRLYKTSQLMQYNAKVAVCSEIRTKTHKSNVSTMQYFRILTF
jgi:hypothetical protein